MKPLLFLAALCAAASSMAAAADTVIAVVPMGTTHEYWKAMHAGAIKAAKELQAAGRPVQIIWKGSLREDDRDAQAQVVENFVGRQVAGIVLAPLDNHALIAPVEEAHDAHIPVVLVDSPLHSDLPASLVATDNREGGRIAGRYLGKLLGGKGKAILLRNIPGAGSTEEREGGFMEVMQKEFPGIELISTDQHAGVTRDTAKTAAENLLSRFGSEVNGVFAPNESSATGMLLALRDAGLAGGKVKFVGFDSAAMLVAGLKAGDVQALVVQDPFKMGYLGVKTVVSVIDGKTVPKMVDTGVGLVTTADMDQPDKAALIHPITAE